VFMATVNIVKVSSNYARQEKAILQSSLLLATLTESIFTNANIDFEPYSRVQAEDKLKEIFLQRQILPDSFILLARSDGLILGSSVANSSYVGQKIEDIIPEILPLEKIGKHASISDVSLVKQPYYVSSIRLDKNNGLILVASSQTVLSSLWRDEVTSGVLLFSGVSAILLLILFSHCAQVRRVKEIDDLLSEANIRVETALSRGRCGIWDFDFISKRFYWSQSMYEILGIPYAGKTLSFGEVVRLIHSKDKDIYDIARSVMRGKSVHLDKVFRIRHSNGNYVWMRARATVMRTISGQMRIIGIAIDVTEQHYLEQRYAEADQRLEEAIKCTSEAFVLWDKNDRLVMCNVHYQKAYGLPDHVLLPGTKRLVVKQAETHPIIECYTSDPGCSGQAITKEVKLADLRWLQINEWRTRDGGIVSVGTDITQLKRNQKKLRESERRLMATINDLSTSRQVLERQKMELSIANANYQSEKERAEAANKAKSDFLAKMSHELRTPLNAILGFSEIIKSEMFGSLGSTKYYEYAKDIHDSGKHLLNLIDDILEMSKIEAENICINKTIINLESLIKESIRFITIPSHNKNIQIEEKISQGLTFNADARAIKQILINILTNAVKFTDNGGKIIVRARKTGDLVIMTIADTGIGISRSALKRVGQPFEQVQDQYVKRRGGGSGLGLAISYALSSLHGGRMRVFSQEEIGTTVVICMPSHE
ncbi:PAS domain S-box protein, partial [Liberibacter sp. Z1]|nr:PAS domain S-box protein [Candidatus Liberibacter sp.]